VVALNKMDLEDAGALVDEVRSEVMAAALRHQQEQPESAPLPPLAIVPCSALSGESLARPVHC
jgi:translation elongation factor EF-1alpha